MDELDQESELFADLYSFVDYGNELFVQDAAFANVAVNGLIMEIAPLDITD